MAKVPKAIADMSTLARVIFDIDTIPPSIPSNVVGTAFSSTRIDLSWAASVDTGGSGLSGYLLYRGGVQVATPSATSFSDVSLTASTAYQYQVAAIDAAGNISAKTTAITVTTQASTVAPVLTFPRIMLVGNGGDQSYGSNATTGYPKWTTAASGTAAFKAVQALAAYDAVIISGIFEGWDTSGVRDRDDLCQALLKKGTSAVALNKSRPTTPFFYHVMCQGETAQSGGGYQQLINQIVAMNGWLYESPGGTGTITPAADSGNLINYATAWPGIIGSAQIGQSIVGTIYGSTRTGSPTGAQGVARTNGNYAAIKLLIRNNAGIDASFVFNPQMASSSAQVMLDNCFVALNGGGAVANSSLDGITIAPGTQQGNFPAFDTVQPTLARGNHNFFDQLQIMVSTYGAAGQTAYNFANFGQYANKYQFGTTALTAGLENTLHGGLLENTVGAGVGSWECFQTGNPNTGNTNYASGWPNLLANYYQGMDFCQAPKLVGVGVRLPATDGSQTASWPVGAGTTVTTVTTGTALAYQLMRYGLCTALLDDGYFAPGVNGYDWSLAPWCDEYGDDSLGQVNVKRGYLGMGLTVRPTTPTWAQGTLGVWSRSFTNGIAIVNPRGNGAQTVALGATYKRLLGTQQPSINSGATVTSITLADGDGIILLGPTTSGLLPATHSVQSALPLTIIAPYTGMSANNRYAKEYPGGTYNPPIVAYGGKWPYIFSITGLSGATVGNTPQTPGYGQINWPNAVAGTYPVTVGVVDQAGVSASVSYTLVVSTSGTIFVDAVNGKPFGTGTGTKANPFKTMADWYFAGTTGSASRFDTTYANSMVYYMNGTYLMDACFVDNPNTPGECEMGNKPKIHLPWPGQTAVNFNPNVSGGDACWYYGAVANVFIGNVNVTDLASNGSSGFNQFVRLSSGATDCVFFQTNFSTPSQVVSGSNNQSFIMVDDNHPAIAQRIAISGCTFNNTLGRDLVLFYYSQYYVCENNTIAGVNDGIGFFSKLGFNDTITIRNNTGLQANTGRCLWSADGYNNVTNADICWNNYKSSGAGMYFGPDPGGAASGIYSYRNTWQVSEHVIDDIPVTITVINDVTQFKTSGAAPHGYQIVNSVSGGSLNITVSGEEAVGTGTYVTAAGVLLPALSTLVGTRGSTVA